MKFPHTSSHSRTKSFFRQLQALERRGCFEDALVAVSEDWADPSFEPEIADLPKPDAAELILRFGSLIGYHGHIKKIGNAQLRARDFLTNAHERFAELGVAEKIAECDNHLALTYWRAGEIREADSWVEQALARNLSETDRTRLFSYMTRMLINLAAGRLAENVEIFEKHEGVFRKYGGTFLCGGLYQNAGLTFKNLGRFSEALRCLELAKHFNQRAGNLMYVGAAENNLAQVYKTIGKFALAHRSIDAATSTFRQIGDLTREGFSYDTKASIYLCEGKYEDALLTIEKAVTLLKDSENTAYLAESLANEACVLLNLDNFASAVAVLFEAVEFARTNAGEEAGRKLIEQFAAAVKEKNAADERPAHAAGQLAAGELQLELPTSISGYDDYQGIWINNSHLEAVGLAKGSLAIVAKDRVKKGDLIAISEIESGEVSCGFYDSDFGIVCLDGCDRDPQLFNESDVRILGRIVGVATPGKEADGKLIVEPLTL